MQTTKISFKMKMSRSTVCTIHEQAPHVQRHPLLCKWESIADLVLEWKSPVHMVSVSEVAPWQTTSAVLYSTEDYVAAFFRPMESEKTVKRPMVRPA